MYTTDQLISLIQNTAAAYGIDPGIAVAQLAWESGNFNSYYVYGPGTSTARAMGIAQFISATGNTYGLKTTADFYNPDKAVPAWAKYMSHLLSVFGGRYDLALAGYNTGEGRAALKQALANGDTVLNYGIYAETRNYVSRILQNAGYNATDIPLQDGEVIPDSSGGAIDDSGLPLDDASGNDTIATVIAVLLLVFFSKGGR